MQKILIAGANSYIGTSFQEWLQRYPGAYRTHTLDLLDPDWSQTSLSGYDAVFHVAGIAHTRETRKNRELIYRVNRDLAFAVAQKARAAGVKQFIFLSSMSVYGPATGMLHRDSPPAPGTVYGRSKLQAEELLASLNGRSFKVAVLRPPMVYGRGCRGNYPRLAALARRLPLFPRVENRRSLLYIGNLCEFVRLLIDDEAAGLFFPQNAEYGNTGEMARLIAGAHGKSLYVTKAFNPILQLLAPGWWVKAFGSLAYEQDMSLYPGEYRVYDLKASILLTEGEPE